MVVPRCSVYAPVAKVRQPENHSDNEAIDVAEQIVGGPVFDVVSDELLGFEMKALRAVDVMRES